MRMWRIVVLTVLLFSTIKIGVIMVSKLPCECEDMKWFFDNYDVVQNISDHWMLTWLVVDKSDDGRYYKQAYALKFDYCPFCGDKIDKN